MARSGRHPYVKTKTAGIYRRGNRYRYTYRVRGVQRWGSAASYEEARRLKRQAEADDDRGEARELATIAFGAYARAWVATYQGRTSSGFRESTRRSYRQMLERIIPFFDAQLRLRLGEIEPRHVKALVRWLMELEDPRRPGRLLGKSTIRQHVAVVRAMLGDATEEGVIRSNPAAGIRVSVPEGDETARPAPSEKRALTIDELRRLLAALPEHYRLLAEFLAHTGLRIGEASELRWGRDVILSGRPYVRVRWQFADGRVCPPKTRYGKRDIPLSPGLAAKLAAAQPPFSDGRLVFTTPSGARLDRHNLLSKVLAPAGRAAGVPWVTPHTFRHTCASLLFAPVEHGGGGKNAKQVQEWLGHHSPAYTLKEYVHLVDAGVGDATFLDAVTLVAA
ncbi:MAG TPA: tyrosine-type recombinase/integrase [Solirubrobacteraceae bacterium]|jgi:integrase|nr:tyrosine-type recombinase/integrase [Solirubrobacteraceae bacterium]